ncbi:hypothetical protein ELE00_36010, partial [Klebsiella pneumoniae]|nr:hypothetical protein [Klebsiella pneumoniae]
FRPRSGREKDPPLNPPLPGGAALTGARRPITNVGQVRRSRHPAQKRLPTRSHCPAALTLARAYEIAGPAVPSRM